MVVVTLAVLCFIAYVVLTENKQVGSFIQLGEIQRRKEVNHEIQESAHSSKRSASQSEAKSNTQEEKEEEKQAAKNLVLAQQQITSSSAAAKLTLSRASFTIGVLNACGTCFILGAHPTMVLSQHLAFPCLIS